MPKIINLLVQYRILAILAIMVLFYGTGCLKSKDPGLPISVQNTLNKAQVNRPELMKAILRFDSPEDSIKREALYFLISNLPQQYTIYVSIADSQEQSIQYNPLDFPNDSSLKQYLDNLTSGNGSINYQADSFGVDLKQITAEYLVTNIEEAYVAWKESKYWQEFNFDIFKKWILPYRVANEPLTYFRSHFKEKFKNEIPSNTTTIEKINLIDSIINNTISYDERFVRSPNPQSILALENSKRGSSLDIAIYKVYAFRSMGIPASIDYCPFYSDTIGGIFTASVFFPNGYWKNMPPKEKPHPFAENKTPKVYRRTFDALAGSLYTLKESSEHTPPFLGHYDYIDVTRDYLPVGIINLTDIHANNKFVYLAVYNDKEWKAVDWSYTDSTGNVTFRNVGKGQRYRLVNITEKKMQYLTDPFYLND